MDKIKNKLALILLKMASRLTTWGFVDDHIQSAISQQERYNKNENNER